MRYLFFYSFCLVLYLLFLPLFSNSFAQYPPPPVTGVGATALACASGQSPIKITWTNPPVATNGDWHKIEKTTDGTTWALAGYTDGSQPLVAEYTDMTPTGGTWYAYRVRIAVSGFTGLSKPANSPWVLSVDCTLSPSSIAGTVFVDKNSNGYRDIGEDVYLGGATVNLSHTSGNFTATTDGTGQYFFNTAQTGSNSVNLVVPLGYHITTTNPVVLNL